MSWFPTIDPTEGVQLTEDGRDIAPIYPEDRQRWTVAVVRAALWLFRGTWRYDRRAGVEYLQKILGHVPDLRVLHEAFRPPIAKYVNLSELVIREESETIFVRFKGTLARYVGRSGAVDGTNVGTGPGGGLGGGVFEAELNVFEPPAIPTIEPVAWDLRYQLISIRMSEALNPYGTVTPADFRVEYFVPYTVVSVALVGANVQVTLNTTPDTAPGAVLRLVYTPGYLSGVSGAVAAPFVLEFTQLAEPLIDEFGDPITTETGAWIYA